MRCALRPMTSKIFTPSSDLHFLHGIGHGGLALVQRGGGLGIAAGIDHGQQRAPLLQGNSRVARHIYLFNR